MRKILTVLSAIATVFCMNAATAVWSASALDCANNTALDGISAQINSNLSIAFANGEATDNNYIRYRSVTALPKPVIAFYSKNVITLSAKDAVITSIEFNINTEEGGNDATPGWKFTANGTTLSAESNTWTGSAEEVVLIGGSKTSIVNLKIEYTPSTPVEPGTELTNTWMATQLTDVANNDVLDGMTFNINDALSFSLANNGSDKDIIFKKTSSAPTTINIYSKGQITFKAAEGTTINSIKFIVNTSEGTSNTPGWELEDEAKNSYKADNDTWTGNATEITFTDKSAVQLMGFEITYVTAGGNQGGDDGDDDDDTGEYESAALFFSGDLVGQGEIAQDVTLSDNGTSVHFTSGSENAQIDDISFNYGTAEEYTAIRYRYRPGGKSSNGVNSTNKGVFTFPCKGTLYLYAFNNQNDERSLQLIQNDETIFDHTYLSTDCEKIPGEGDDAKDINIYPIYNVEVAKGTATLLWPVNQVMLSGFEFIPATKEEPQPTEKVKKYYLHYTDEDGNYISTFQGSSERFSYFKDNDNDGTYELEHIEFAANSTTYFVISAYPGPLKVDADDNGDEEELPGADVNSKDAGIIYMAAEKDNSWSGFEGTVYGKDEEGNVVAFDPTGEYEAKPFNYVNDSADRVSKLFKFTPSENGQTGTYDFTTDSPIETGIETVTIEKPADGAIYNVYGQRVDENYRGIVIKNGKKHIIR